MKNKLVLNSAEDAEIISVRLDPERFPIAYANKVECLMLSGLSEEFRFRGDAGCITWRKATVDEIIEHFKRR